MRARMTFLRNSASVLVLVAGFAVATAASAQTATQEDLRALAFYLEQNDQPAVQAELRRLRRAFPDWRPPSNLNELLAPTPGSGAAGPDIAGVWQRIERSDFAGARQLIDQNRRTHPDWSPDPEMLRVLELNEAQAGFDRAVAARNAPEAIAIARRVPRLMSCDRINNAWQLAEMYRLAGQTANAVASYKSTLASCTRYSDAEPTLEKADAVASASQMADLFNAARSAAPANAPRLDALEARLRAGRGQGPAQPQATAAASPPPASQPRGAPPAQPAALPEPSAVSPGPTGVAAPGPALRSLPLRGDNRVAATRAAKEAEQWARCLANSARPRSLDLVYERSWCALSHDRPSEALVGFAAVAERGGALGGNVPRDVRYGLALAHLSLQMTEEGARIAGTAPLTDAQRREIEIIVLDQRAVRAYRLGEYRQAIAMFNALEQTQGALRRDLAILRAYAYLNSGQRGVAREQFERLHAQLATPDTRAGLNAARGGGS